MQMKDRVAVITGGKRIGCVVATELASRGVDIVVSYRSSKESAESTVDDIRSHGGRAVAVQADVRVLPPDDGHGDIDRPG